MRLATWGAVGAVIMGGATFLSGFIAPLLLTPGANQGPLLGFCLAPVGFVVGFLVGAFIGYFERLTNTRKLLLLAVCAALVVLAVVAMILPYKNKPGYRRSPNLDSHEQRTQPNHSFQLTNTRAS